MRKRLVLLFSLFTIYASFAFAETLPGPSRDGLTLQTVPIEALAPAIYAAPDALEALETYNLAGNVPTQNGFSRSLVNAREVRLGAADALRPTPFETAGGVVTRSAHGDLVWSGEVRVAEAHALRLHLGSVALPPGTRMWVYAPGAEAAQVTPAALRGRSEIWTGLVFGESLWLEVAVPAAALSAGHEARFTLDRVLELVELDDRGRPVVAGPGVREKDEHCLVSTQCAEQSFAATIEGIKDAVARIFFVKDGGGFICSGGLLQDTDPTGHRPLFLTANHCIPNPTVAETVVSFFRLFDKSCADSSQSPDFDRVDGATFLANRPESDATLIELAGLPPNPRLLEFDHDLAAARVGRVVNNASFPGGFNQVFSRQRITETCSNDDFFAGQALFSGIGPGSSGSLAVNSDGKVVGQLLGLCAVSAPVNICDNPTGAFAYYGRMSAEYDVFSQFLDPPVDGFFNSPVFPDFAFQVKIVANDETRLGTREQSCLSETECVSGAIPGRSEVFLRIVGPRPNGKLWPTIVKFTTSRVEVTVRQLSTGIEKEYILEGAAPGVDELPGLFDRGGFDP